MLCSVLLSLCQLTVVFSVLIILFTDQISLGLGRVMAATPSTSLTTPCPSSYWDKPSKRCTEPLINALQTAARTKAASDHQPAVLSSDEHRTVICATWNGTNECFKQLLGSCANDSTAISTLNSHRRRFSVYSKDCNDHSKRTQQLSDCFLVHFIPTQTCAEAFDKYFRFFVKDKQYSQACRIVSSALKCFHDLSSKIAAGHCGSDGAAEYNSSYIKPVVDQSRETVTSKCTLAPPYDTIYYKSSSLSAILAARGRHVAMFFWFVFLLLFVNIIDRSPTRDNVR